MPLDPHDSGDASRTRVDLARLADDSTAWPRLVGRLTSQLRVLAHFRMGPTLRAACEPDDLVQEVLSELVQSLDRFDYRGPGSLLRYAAGILRHKLADLARRQDRVPVPESRLRPAGEGDGAPAGLLDALQASQAGASWRARRSEREQRVVEALARLPEGQREVLLLKLYEELTQREIAARLGLDESSVSTRVRKGLEACARRLADLAG